MTTLASASPVTAVSRAMVHAMIDYVVAKGYRGADGALGIRGQLGQAEPLSFEHGGQPVRVVWCESALAVREALLDRQPDRWLVIVTDRDELDLGAGVLAHLLGQQLRSPDPWQAVRQRFRAVSIDTQLTSERGHREIAVGLLEATPAGGWPAAGAGVLTRDHAYGSVAQALLELPDGPVDLVSVLGWTTRRTLPTRISELRERAGDPLTDAVLRWVATAAGPVAGLVAQVVGSGRPTDLVPFGLVVDVLHQVPGGPRAAAETALARLSHHWGRDHEAAIRLVAPVARTVTTGLLTDGQRRTDAQQAIDRAESLIREAGAEDLTLGSDLLPSGLTRRFRQLADLLGRDPVRRLPGIERAWLAVDSHALSPGDPRTDPFHAAIRLARWLEAETQGDGTRESLAALARRQLEVDAWVDSAVNDAAAGVDDPGLGATLASVLEAVRKVRDRHDIEFAAALARGTAEEVGAGPGYLEHGDARTYLLERVLPDVVLPLARQDAPVLLLVLDGLSTGVATEVLERLIGGSRPRWAEQLLPGCSRRAAGLAVLPTITEISRASLLSGSLARGQQAVELTGYQALTRAHGLAGAALFHKRILDTTRLGFSISDEVRSAIDDPEIRLVSCVLNTIDDALDRSDPAGTTWSADAVKHLEPLLERARSSGRRVVITADHGHVVERRLGTQRLHGSAGPGRHRPVGDPVEDGEVLVAGPRVLAHGGRAILAVSERLRYGPLKAGYHGGAAPAEALVPLVLLTPIELAEADGGRLAPPQQPAWWSMGAPDVSPPVSPGAVAPAVPTLFDEAEGPPAVGTALGQRVVSSSAYAEARTLAGRLRVTDDQVAALVDRLVSSPQRRLTLAQCAVVLGVAPASIGGAVEQVRKLLNLEGYPVLSREAVTDTVLLDVDLLVEQFAVSR